MKKAKIMLTAIVVLAGVGGAMAFKAQKFSKSNVYCKFAGESTCRTMGYTTEFIPFVETTTNPCKDAQTTSTYTTTDCINAQPQPTTTVYVTDL